MPLSDNEHARLETKLDLVLRAAHILIRINAAPNEPKAQMKHFQALQDDLAPWLKDYADVFIEPGQPDSN